MLDVTICIVSCLECKDVVYESTLLIFNTSPLFFSTFIHFSDHMPHWKRVLANMFTKLSLLGVFRKFVTFYSFLKYH